MELVKIKPHIANMAVFRRINLMDDRYPIKSLLDVIFCRNVMIYFDRETQAKCWRSCLDISSRAGTYL